MATALQTGPYDAVDSGTYEVLRDRLTAQAAELARAAEALNTRRAAEFGAVRLDLTGAGRLRTEHASVPRDVVAVGGRLLFGFNGVHAGARPDVRVGDVLALYDRDQNRLPEDAVPGLLDDPAFVREFAALHRYYRQARLLRLQLREDRLLAVFRTGEKADDIRALRWDLTADGRAVFLDARGDRDHVLPPAHDFAWTATTREDHRLGRHPHVSIQGEIHVSTVGGTLTVKTEDDTETGEGVHSEPVDEPLQALADADIAHARVGALILLRVRPYKEDADRYLVFNTLTRTVVRLDGIGQGCRRLPEDQGIVFAGGYCLATGAYKTYELDTTGLEFEREVRSPYGEDVLYAFHARAEGRGLLLSYNTIREEIATPLVCHGWALFEDGALLALRADPAGAAAEPARVHPLQLWTSPYVSDTHAAATAGTGPLARVGNADLVRGISDCLSISRAVAETTPTVEVYEALAAACVRTADTHHWLGDPELGGLRAPLEAVRGTAEQVLAEFRTVRTLTRQAADALEEAAGRLAAVVRRLRGEAPRGAAAWVGGLTELRAAQGHLLTLKEMRYADTARIDDLAAQAGTDLAAFGKRAVAHLSREDAFAEHHTEVEQLVADAEAIESVAAAAPVAARLDELAGALHTVTEVVAGLDIGDATVRTSVLERIAEVLGGVNRARALLGARRRELADREGRAEFAAEFALLGQAVTGALAAADSPEACDEQLSGALVRLENLESRFAEFDDFLGELAAKRTEVYDAFSARKQTLLDARARRAEQLTAAAARILETVARRAATLADADAVSTYFASDPMVAKVRRTTEELRELGDPVRAEELDGRLKAARQEAARALRDRTDLYADGGRTIRLGAHRFAVTTQPLDLTLVPDGDGLAFALTGTDYRAPVTDPSFTAAGALWERTLPSESPEVYRAEHLAARLLREVGPEALAAADDLPDLVRRAAREAYDEGYERGVHDHDATVVLTALLPLYERAGTERHEPAARAAAHLFWSHGTTPQTRTAWTRRAASLSRARAAFGPGTTSAIAALEAELAAAIGEWTARAGLLPAAPGGAWAAPGGSSAAVGAVPASGVAYSSASGGSSASGVSSASEAFSASGGALPAAGASSPPGGTRPAAAGLSPASGGTAPGATGATPGVTGTAPGATGAAAGAAGAAPQLGGSAATAGTSPASGGAPPAAAGASPLPGGAPAIGSAAAIGPAAGDLAAAAAAYLFEELTSGPDGFVVSAAARTLLDKFRRTVGGSAYDEDLAALDDLAARHQLAAAWLTAYADATGTPLTPGDLAEAVAVELCPDLPRHDSDLTPVTVAEGLLGAHPRITGRALPLRIDEFLARTRRFAEHEAPAFRAHLQRRTALVAAERARLRLDEHRPRSMASFVRNRLVDEVYLPLVGDSLARQIGTAGATKRTDTGGLLLLLSPPGYGKTTLMEYVADRLGLMMVRVSGPALGHAVTSLDPAEAPNATARQEIEKINFALAAGNNTLLHLDDIQHTSPELLQKFIPLCDATRRVDGVHDGAPRTYDLRGKRFAVCMTGNPYTESGERFRVPDMLANRADVWNLGDVLTGKEDAFALSFLENALTSNPVLAPLAGRDRADLELLVRLAEGDPAARADRLTHPYAPAELEQITAVLRHLLTARETVLAVNAAYIASAAQAEETRSEPPFRLQGSYRTMNRIAQRVRPVMNAAELAAVLDDHFTAEAQTLTTGAEANLLKLAELRGTLTPGQAERWAALKSAHARAQVLGGPAEDPLTRATNALALLADRMSAIEAAITAATGGTGATGTAGPRTPRHAAGGEGR
ncbi:DNA repair ATPase [Streptomyces sp. BBFR115]|uniref:DNA repair ATPase n=1 Tax=Streptomyces sp. BBFR115 TaxID=3448173 RepID=UPI003F776C21